MKRHSLDLVALLSGLAFAMTGAAFLAHELAGGAIDPAWVSAIGFVALGLIALAITLFHRPRAREEE